MKPLTTPQLRLMYVMGQKKMKIAVLAKAVGVSDAAVSRWRTISDMEQQHLIKVCETLDIRADWLLFGKGTMNQYEQSDLTEPEQELVSFLRSVESQVSRSLLKLFRVLENVFL